MRNIKLLANLFIVLSLFLTNVTYAQDKLSDDFFNEIDQIIFISEQDPSGEMTQKTISHVSQITTILGKKNALSLTKSKAVISTLDDQIAFYAGNDDMVKYLKHAKKAEQYNLDGLSKNANAIEAIGYLGTALNVYDLLKTTNQAYENITKGNANLENSYLPVAEKIASFNPVAGGVIHIKNEVNTILNISRDIGNEYNEIITKIRDRYFRQYNILANKGINGQNPEGMMELFKDQREEMRGELDDILKTLNEGTLAGLPVFGKQKARDELIKLRYDILGADKEKAIETKQKNFWTKMYHHYEVKQSSQDRCLSS